MKKIIVFMFALIICFIPFEAMAAEYTISSYAMSVDINSDGSADIIETLAYEFSGTYNGILSAFDIGDVDALEDLSLYVDGDTELRLVDEMNYEPFTYTVKREGSLLNVQAYAPGDRGVRTFRYEYRLLGLCQRYRDAARLNYKLIGTNNQVTLKGATIKITLPGEVYDAWAHGAMGAGDIHSEDGTLVYGPANVPSGRFVEADILFDQASLSDAMTEHREVIEKARAQEAELAQRELEQSQRLDAIRYGLIAVFAAFAVLCMLVVDRIGRTVGYRRKIVPDSDLKKLKGVKSAVAQWIYSGRVDTDGLTGTLLELVSTGAVQMNRPQTKTDELSFVLKNREEAGLTEHQRYALEWLFEDDEPLYADSLNANDDEKRARAYADHIRKYSMLVKQEAKAAGYMSGLGRIRSPLILLCVMGILLSAGLFCLSAIWAGALAALLALALIAVSFRLRRLSDEGERIYAALDGLARQKGGVSVPQEDLQWLIPISAALSCLGPFFERMDGTWDAQDDMVPYWIYTGWHHDMGRVQRGMSDSSKHNQEILSQNSSSSGGDFSSGGGGGGGGHGAW